MKDKQTGAKTFDDRDVARCYAHRPAYAPELYRFLLELVPARNVLVDLGCGPGKIAAAMADDFTNVIAIDPAIAMIDEARTLHANRHPNIRWLCAPAEDAALPAQIDLVTAGTSIHWMTHDVLFPKLAERSKLVAVISGDIPANPPWQESWRAAMAKWLERLHNEKYDETAFAADGRSYEPWLRIAGRKSVIFTFHQSVRDYIECQHSRASWTRARMGTALAAEFDRDLEALLQPHAQDGMLKMELTSELVWGCAS